MSTDRPIKMLATSEVRRVSFTLTMLLGEKERDELFEQTRRIFISFNA